MMILEVLFLFLSYLGNNISARDCFPPDSLPIPHESYHPGDFLIGGITSQMWYFFHKLSFQKQPSQDQSFQSPISHMVLLPLNKRT
ncbi:hypothetical protein E2320_003561 [Naja naja]|nr:hypothetical protein E2320_003561 [Naja naja]